MAIRQFLIEWAQKKLPKLWARGVTIFTIWREHLAIAFTFSLAKSYSDFNKERSLMPSKA
jgi:hypothetical protein